jgi:hypothetical protein
MRIEAGPSGIPFETARRRRRRAFDPPPIPHRNPAKGGEQKKVRLGVAHLIFTPVSSNQPQFHCNGTKSNDQGPPAHRGVVAPASS